MSQQHQDRSGAARINEIEDNYGDGVLAETQSTAGTPDHPRAHPELVKLLENHSGRIGDVFRLHVQQKLLPAEVAEKLQVNTPGFVYNYKAIIDAALCGVYPAATTRRKQTTTALRGLIRRAEKEKLSNVALAELREHLKALTRPDPRTNRRVPELEIQNDQPFASDGSTEEHERDGAEDAPLTNDDHQTILAAVHHMRGRKCSREEIMARLHAFYPFVNPESLEETADEVLKGQNPDPNVSFEVGPPSRKTKAAKLLAEASVYFLYARHKKLNPDTIPAIAELDWPLIEAVQRGLEAHPHEWPAALALVHAGKNYRQHTPEEDSTSEKTLSVSHYNEERQHFLKSLHQGQSHRYRQWPLDERKTRVYLAEQKPEWGWSRALREVGFEGEKKPSLTDLERMDWSLMYIEARALTQVKFSPWANNTGAPGIHQLETLTGQDEKLGIDKFFHWVESRAGAWREILSKECTQAVNDFFADSDMKGSVYRLDNDYLSWYQDSLADDIERPSPALIRKYAHDHWQKQQAFHSDKAARRKRCEQLVTQFISENAIQESLTDEDFDAWIENQPADDGAVIYTAEQCDIVLRRSVGQVFDDWKSKSSDSWSVFVDQRNPSLDIVNATELEDDYRAWRSRHSIADHPIWEVVSRYGHIQTQWEQELRKHHERLKEQSPGAVLHFVRSQEAEDHLDRAEDFSELKDVYKKWRTRNGNTNLPHWEYVRDFGQGHRAWQDARDSHSERKRAKRFSNAYWTGAGAVISLLLTLLVTLFQ